MINLNLGALALHLTAESTKLMQGLRAAEMRIQNSGRRIQALGRDLSLKLTVPLMTMGGVAVRQFAAFDDAMTKSTAIMGNVSDDMRKQMAATARQISTKSITSSIDLAKSYYYLASAGMDAAQSISALPVVEKFATAGAFDMASATDLLTDAQSALGLVSKDVARNEQNLVRVSDVLVRANTLANASVEQFSRSLTNKAASALRLVNKDVEEGTAVLAAFADQGWKGERAGEALNIVLRDLQTSAIRNESAWKRMGLSVFDSNGTMRNLADIIGDLERRFLSMSDEQKRSTATMLGFQDRSFSALATLLGTSDQIRRYESELRAAGGTTEQVANSQLSSFTSQMKILWNQVKDAAFEIGERLAPSIGRVGEQIQVALEWWRGLNDQTKNFIVYAMAAAAALGPILLIFGKIVSLGAALLPAFQAVITVVLAVKTAVIALGSAVIATFGWWLIPIAAVAAAIAGILYYMVGPEGLINAWKKSVEVVKKFFSLAFGFMANFKHNMKTLFAWFSENWRTVLGDVGRMATAIIRNSIYNFTVLIKTMWSLFKAFMNWVGLLVDKVITGAFFKAIGDVIVWAYDAFLDFFKQLGKWLKNVFSGKELEPGRLSERLREAELRGTNELNLIKTAANIMKTGFEEMKSPLEGFESKITNMPELRFDLKAPKVQQEMEQTAKAAEESAKSNTDWAKTEIDASNKMDKATSDLLQSLGARGVETPQERMGREDTGEFREMAMRRFSLEGLVGFRLPQKQQVEAQGVESRLDTLIQIAKNKQDWALS